MGKRTAQQREDREEYAAWIAKKVASRLQSGEHNQRMHGTNRLLPVGSMRRRCIRAIFGGWAKKFQGYGRLFTRALASRICHLARDRVGLENPPPPEEIARMHFLMKTARKRGVARPRKSAMDNLETLPLEYGAEARLAAVFFFFF